MQITFKLAPVFCCFLLTWFMFTIPVVFGTKSFFGEGVIQGSVKDENNNPLPGATVILHELNTGTTTDGHGQFEFKNLRDGIYSLQVKNMGFASVGKSVVLVEGYVFIPFTLQHTHIELREVTVRESATGMVQSEQSLSITTANNEFFSQSADLTLMQALQRIPGISSMDIGSTVSKPAIRGLGFNRLVVAQNNIKQQGQQWGADHGLEIDFYGVERVEIVKGPASLLFGSDAIGGAINIRPPVVPQENSTTVEVQNTARSNNDLLGGSAMAAINRDGRFLRLRVSYQDYADYRVPADSFTYNTWIMPIENRRLKNTSGNDLGLSFISGIRKSWGITSLSVSNFNQKVGFFPASHGIPNPAALQDPGNPRQTEYPQQVVNHFKVSSNTNILMGMNRLELDFGFQQNHRQELNPPHVHGLGPLPEGFVELDLLLHTFTAQGRLHRKQSDRHTIILGASASLQDNKRDGYNFLLPDFRYGEAGLFMVSRWRIKNNLFFNAGIRGDMAGMEVQQYLEPIWRDTETIDSWVERAPGIHRNYVNAAFSSGLSWNMTREINIKTNIGSSFRNPTAIELAANGIHHGSFRHEMGDTTLNPERAWQFDVGFTYSRKEFYLHLSPFLNYFPNFLFLNPSGSFSRLPGAGQIYKFEQAEALHMGGEVYVDWHITHALHTSLGGEFIWAQNLENNYPLPFTPPASVLGEMSYKWHEPFQYMNLFKVLLSSRFVNTQDRVARNEPATAKYILFNTGIVTQIAMGDAVFDISFMVNNLFDQLYKNHLSFYRILELPEPGRNFVVSLKTDLSW